MLNLVPLEDERSTTPTRKNLPFVCETRVLGGRYQLRRLIGRGGTADVFLGDDLILERAVAVKLLHTHLAEDMSALERFRREAMTLAAVRSAHVVGIHDIGADGDGVFIVMEYVEGHTLEEVVARSGPMSVARAGAVLAQLLDGLTDVHALGLVHRDIKPSNIIIGASDHVVLLDLGIALDPLRVPLTAPGMVAGTPAFLPPESSTRAESDYASDVYQVGLLMLFLLTGARRFPAKGIDDLFAKISPSLGAMARRALAADPAERYPSALVMRAELESVLTGPAPEKLRSDRPTVQARPLARPCDRAPQAPAPAINLAEVPTKVIKTSDDRVVRIRRERVRLPALEEGDEAAAIRGKIMLVDEDLAFCRTLQRMLRGHDTLIVTTATQALAHLEGGSRADVILCGLPTPRLFHSAVFDECPAQADAIIFLSAGRSLAEARALVAKKTNKCLGRPFDLALLKRLIYESLVASRVVDTT
ncbi:MAG: serine/threonine-protein kinase [Myxococcota bacterium]|nr:protein kinase [Deltaproteobacteria bacterium]MDQ3334820.1 serine/threonine-protein kinase [Myxococcota bacterium]